MSLRILIHHQQNMSVFRFGLWVPLETSGLSRYQQETCAQSVRSLGMGCLLAFPPRRLPAPLTNLWHHWGGMSEKVDAKGRSLTEYLPVQETAFHCLWWLLKWKTKRRERRRGEEEGVRRREWGGGDGEEEANISLTWLGVTLMLGFF